MIISVALLLALFSGFFPFVNTYGNVMQYTTAYYGAMSALERGALAIRYTGPGFDGESWRKAQNNGTPNNIGKSSDQRVGNFYTYGNGNDSLLRSIKSSTDSIPATGMGNVEPTFIDNKDPNKETSKNYNTLNYTTTELIPLGIVEDISAEKYYTGETEFKSLNFWGIKGSFRLNPYLFEEFSWGLAGDRGKLCNENCPNSPQGDRRDTNQVVATRTIKGKYQDNEFTILPKDGTNINRQVIEPWDSLIRKENISLETKKEMTFANNFHPFPQQYPNGTSKDLNIISNNEKELVEENWFKGIISNVNVKNVYLSFSLANFLRTKGTNLYPFLEYKFYTTDGSKIADRFYTLKGIGKVGDRHVLLQIQKPTLKQPALGNFTIIF